MRGSHLGRNDSSYLVSAGEAGRSCVGCPARLDVRTLGTILALQPRRLRAGFAREPMRRPRCVAAGRRKLPVNVSRSLNILPEHALLGLLKGRIHLLARALHQLLRLLRVRDPIDVLRQGARAEIDRKSEPGQAGDEGDAYRGTDGSEHLAILSESSVEAKKAAQTPDRRPTASDSWKPPLCPW